ncbi:BatD family protein [Marinobacter sp.]|uniref:BatD family protein n=1 Tax=Marinobacter sp. TaxID=50741 RepID=UPI001A0BAEB5|nr:BatD family protein [Marinobacter sp.]MBE0485773.1 protein BatD [Marinobacter sp.]
MVKRFVTSAVSLCLLLMVAMPAAWANELTVEPDRTQLYEGEVLTLTVKGSMKIDVNLTNLFSFNLSQLPSPDIEQVQPDFEILARNQRYSVQTVNNEMVGEITWTYRLAPTRTGTLTIPELTFQDSTSAPVMVEVLGGTPPNQPAASRDSFIELSADKADVYVQEQLVLTVRLYFSGNLIRGELSEPEHPNAIIESLGRQQEFNRYRDGTRYRVVERRYAIFPQQPGEFRLAPISFEGQARDSSGQLRFLRDRQQLFDVQVKPIPDNYPAGRPWLPAIQMTLTEEGLPSSTELSAGTNLNRQLTLEAIGLPSEALPDLPQAIPDAIRSYPEQPIRNTETTAEGLNSALQQVSALVPVQTGDVELPAIRIPWWNTQTDQLEYAELPARRYRIEGDSPMVATPVDDSSQALEPLPVTTSSDQADPGQTSPWLISTVIMAVLWLATAGLWWLSRRRHGEQAQPENAGTANEQQAFNSLKNAIQAGSGQSSALLVSWAKLKYPDQRLVTLEDVLRFSGDPALADAVRQFQEGLFSQHRASSGKAVTRPLINALERLRARQPSPESNQGLAPLFPPGLSN